jgi:hypothetical protein
LQSIPRLRNPQGEYPTTQPSVALDPQEGRATLPDRD